MKDCTCDICGKEDYFLSSVVLNANYGSEHDGERLTIALCGNCFDKLFDLVLDMKPWSGSKYIKNITEVN